MVSDLLPNAGRRRIPHLPCLPGPRHCLGDRDSCSGQCAALLAHSRVAPASGDPLRPGYERLAFVHPESVLSSFLAGSPIESRPLDNAPIFPFRCNLSQRAAVENALTRSVSVIEGPPGTGKTETILNLIVNIVAVQRMTVGIVSFGNAAVDNVRDKLDEQGFGHLIGNLGRREKRDEFFALQAARNTEVGRFLARAPDEPDLERLANLDKRLRGLQGAERIRADRRQALDAHRLELRHFEDHLHRDQLPDVAGLPLLRRSASRFGVTTPYRLQASKAADVLDQTEADTVHKFQGRQKQVVILTTVLDETWRGRTGLAFVDDPQMINVAVSRAIRRFILVTNYDMLPTSRHIRDLVGYIRYHNPGEEVAGSTVVSVFDLLYRAYSQRLRPLAARLRKELKYPSEDIIWTVLHDIIAEQRYAHMTVGSQVLLRNLLPDLGRLTLAQRAYMQHRASVDFVVYNRVTNQPLLAIEVDGFAFHENSPDQRARDALKNEILDAHQMPLLRLPTTGSREHQQIRQALDHAEAHWARLSTR